MLRGLIVASVAVLLLASGASGRPTGGTPVAFVAVPARNEVVAVDLDSAQVVGRVRVPPAPAEVAWFYDTWRARPYVLVTSPAAGAVSLIDAVSQRVVRVWRGLGTPRDVVVEGTRAYVSDARGGRLLVFGTRSRRLLAQLSVGVGARAVAVSDAALVLRGAELAVADLRTHHVDRLTLPERGTDVVKRPDSAEAFVTLPSGRLVRVDWGRRHLRALGRPVERAAGAAFDVFAGDRLWIADPARDRLVLVRTPDGHPLRRLGGCAGASHVAQAGTAWIVASCADRLAYWHTLRWQLRLVGLGGRPEGVDIAVLP